MRAVGCDLPHASAVAAECNQPGDDGSLPKADVPHDHHTTVHAGVGALQLCIDLVEHPVPAHEDGFGGDAGDLEEQRLQGDVWRSVGCKAHCKQSRDRTVC